MQIIKAKNDRQMGVIVSMENIRVDSKNISEGKSSSKVVKTKQTKSSAPGKKKSKQAILDDASTKTLSNEGAHKKKRPTEGVKKKKRPSATDSVQKKKNSQQEGVHKKKRPSTSGAQSKKRPAAMENLQAKKKPAKNKTKKVRMEDDENYVEVPRSAGKKIISVIWDVLFYVFLFLIIGGAIFFNFNDSPDKSFFGYRFMTVLTDSMAPNPDKPQYTDGFKSGSIIFLKKVEPEELKVDDIITFYPVEGNTEAFLTHRLIDIATEMDGEEGLFFTTQGDANTGSDIPIKSSQVVGKVVFKIPFVGTFLDFIRDNIVVVAIFIATLFGFLITLKYYFSMNDYQKAPKNGRKKKRRQA